MGSQLSNVQDANVRPSWVAATFAVLAGTVMVYVPYEFSAPSYEYLFPWVRPLGAALLAGGMLLAIRLMQPGWSRWIGGLGGALCVAAILAYWASTSLRVGGITGWVVLPLVALGVVFDAIPALRHRRWASVPALIGTAAVWIGGVLVLARPALPGHLYGSLLPWALPFGLAFTGAGLSTLFGLARGRIGLLRYGLRICAGLFLLLCAALAARRGWVGATMYASFTVGAGAWLVGTKFRFPATIRWRLWRGMVLASCLPLLVLGGIACVVMQRGIEAQAFRDADLAVDTEAEWLEQYLHAEREALQAHASLESFRSGLSQRDIEGLARSMRVLKFHASTFEALFVTDAQGHVLARTQQGIPALDEIPDRDFFARAATQPGIYVSEPWVGTGQHARVAMSVRIEESGQLLGVLVGTLSLDELSKARSLTSSHYVVQVVDRRGGKLLRNTAHDGITSAQWLPPSLQESFDTAGRGHYVGPDAQRRQVLVAWAQVANTDWIVVVQKDVANAYAFVTRLGFGAVIMVTAAALLSLLLAQWVASEVTRRIRRVREAAEALARGELQSRVAADGADEIAGLSHSFNLMSAQVQAAQTELHRTNEELRSAVALRDEFLSIASHELRTPLTPLKATTQTLRLLLGRKGALDHQRVGAMLDRMDRQTDRLVSLVTDMLDTARLQAGRFPLERSEMDLNELTREVVTRLVETNPDNARMQLELPDAPVRGEWDAQRLEQVLVNLMENAIRYSPQGGPIRVRLEEDAEQVRLVVEDQGIGIPPESLPHLFEPFFRASNATVKHYGGLGLGLHICQEIAERHGGRIRAESEGVEKGSRFTLELPRRPAGEDGRSGEDAAA